MSDKKTEVVVIGAGPGGYAAAFYAADLGKKVILIDADSDKKLGGVCLNRGCIPSKALLNATKLLSEKDKHSHRGISFDTPKIDLKKMRQWKDGIIQKLSSGVSQLAKARGVTVIHGKALFDDSHTVRVETAKGQQFISFEYAIVAVGSKPAIPASFDLGAKRIMTSTKALEIEDIPKDFLVIGGGYIGMELGTVYANLGSNVTVVEALSSILMGADPDLARPVMTLAKKAFKEVLLNTKVVKLSTHQKKIEVVMETNGTWIIIGKGPN